EQVQLTHSAATSAPYRVWRTTLHQRSAEGPEAAPPGADVSEDSRRANGNCALLGSGEARCRGGRGDARCRHFGRATGRGGGAGGGGPGVPPGAGPFLVPGERGTGVRPRGGGGATGGGGGHRGTAAVRGRLTLNPPSGQVAANPRTPWAALSGTAMRMLRL